MKTKIKCCNMWHFIRAALFVEIKHTYHFIKPDFILFKKFMLLQTCSACDFGIYRICMKFKYVDLLAYVYLKPYLQELSNLTLCIMGTLNLSYVYADRAGYDECMGAGSLKTSLPARLYIYMYYLQPF